MRTLLLVLFVLFHSVCTCVAEDRQTQRLEGTEGGVDVNLIDRTLQKEISEFPKITEGEDTPLTREVLAFAKDVFLSKTYDWDRLYGIQNQLHTS